MKKTGRILAGLLTGVMALSLAACGSGSSGSSGSGENGEKTTFRSLYSGEVQTLNYLTTSTTNDYAISANIIDCLVDYEDRKSVV